VTNLRRLTLVREMNGNEEMFRIKERCILCSVVIPDTSTDLEAIDNASGSSGCSAVNGKAVQECDILYCL
jgi:hypothetical protein